MLGDTRSDPGVSKLEQQCPPGPEENGRLPTDLPRERCGAEDAFALTDGRGAHDREFALKVLCRDQIARECVRHRHHDRSRSLRQALRQVRCCLYSIPACAITSAMFGRMD